jgi:pimeloyl-ACP methyl ester carboxylesterase
MIEMIVEADGATLSATYSLGGETAVVALHGAAFGTRDYFLYEHLHRVLPPSGVGVLTFDRRGEGRSTGEPSRGRFSVQVDDALRMCDAVQVNRVGLWGWSQGAWIAPLAAGASRRPAFLVLISSTGVTPAEQMRYYTAQQLRAAGCDEAVVERALDLRTRVEAFVHGEGADEARLQADLRAAALEPWFALTYVPDTLPDADATRDWIAEMDFDPRPSFAHVRVPTLLLYGSSDDVTPVQPSIDAWRMSGADPEICVIAEAGHDLRLTDGVLAPYYERVLIDWLGSLNARR